MNYKVTFVPQGKQISATVGTSLLNVAAQAQVYLPARCGGKAACLMCKVTIDASDAHRVSPPTEAEQRKLGTQIQEGVRLACQTYVCDSVVVQVPEDRLKAVVREQLQAKKASEARDVTQKDGPI